MEQESMIAARAMKQIASQPRMSSDIFNPPPYSSIFFHSSPSPTTFNAAPSTKSTITSASIATAAAKSLSRVMSEHKELLKSYELCLNQLRKTFKESETLRQENTNLRLANAELNDQLNLLVQATLENHNRYQTQSFSEEYGSSSRSEKFGGVLEKEERESDGWSDGYMENSQSQSEKDQEENEKDEEVEGTMPKSISVRSNGYLKINPNSANTSSHVRPVNGPKKVYVRGGSKKDGAIELEVYNQGMFKTELCNKWQETRSCPYGDHCQFAHGIKELRPVIRHPRYKTEVCRMVLAGDPCPYGHRCHFRHALTDEEKLMLPLRID